MDRTLLRKWLLEKAEEGTKSKEGICYSIDVSNELCILMTWEDGFQKDTDDDFVTDDGYGVVVGLAEKNSSFMMSDWARLGESTSFNKKDIDRTVSWLNEQIQKNKDNYYWRDL